MRALIAIVAMFLPFSVLADGKVLATALQDQVHIPDQRALICYSNGIERLVIETRFVGQGTNFAWVVPLPSEPVIEEATAGLFPTLQHLFAPRIVHRVGAHWLSAVALIVLALVYRVWSRAGVVVAILLALVMTAMLLPGLGGSKAAASPGGLSILQQQRVGAFDVAVIQDEIGTNLHQWLTANGFVMPEGCEPVLRSYTSQNWVFAAAQLAVSSSTGEPVTNGIHPLSFTFKTPRAVYPMKLTGVGNGALDLELYVFGPARARAPRLRAQDCLRPAYTDEKRAAPTELPVLHPQLLEFAGGAPVATRLTGKLKTDDMREDIWLDWIPPAKKRSTLYSTGGAFTIALNWGAWVLAAGVVLLASGRGPARPIQRKLRKPAVVLIVMGILLVPLTYILLPKTPIRLARLPMVLTKHEQLQAYTDFMFMAESTNISFVQARAALQGQLSDRTFQRKNHLSGNSMSCEDSPGNVDLRRTPNGFEFLAFDWRGAPQVLGSFVVESNRTTVIDRRR